MVVLGGGAVSHERGTPVLLRTAGEGRSCDVFTSWTDFLVDGDGKETMVQTGEMPKPSAGSLGGAGSIRDTAL